ncbi:nuclear transport factor 2 family protein [Nocardioides sp.]|uniref:nuclear transport factor 2 family protein n=1 Tax=Nocardioides sp. TaxID=35761 RepID=UPI002B277D3D|nr:nuclear transport factor 2 family protein [Nocardioides sp.]
MTLSNDAAAAAVNRYLALVSDGTADEIAALYAEDATLEDPVGSAVLTGRDAIRAFYGALEGLSITTSLITLRTCAGEAAFHFRVETDTGAGVATMEPLEVMTFASDGKIASMRAWWSDADLVFT